MKVHVPLALMAIPFVILFHFIGSENHVSMIYDEKKKPMANKDNSLTVISCNTCLMPEGLARANNLPFVEERLVSLSSVRFYSSKNSVPNKLPIYARQNIIHRQHPILKWS